MVRDNEGSECVDQYVKIGMVGRFLEVICNFVFRIFVCGYFFLFLLYIFVGFLYFYRIFSFWLGWIYLLS